MAAVHTFPLITELFDDTRIPLQYLGDGNPPAASAFELSLLADFLATKSRFQVTTSSITTSAKSIAIAAGRLVAKIVVIGSASGTFALGTTPDGTEIHEKEDYDTDGAVFLLDRYFHSSGTLYFSAFGSGDTLTVKVILINLA
jgi:hypothetical protein